MIYDSKILQSQGPEMAQLFGRHFVSMIISGEQDGQRETFTLSSFFVSVKRQWFVLTAGHSIKALRARVAAGFKIDVWDFNDLFAGGAHKRSVPASMSLDDWTDVFDSNDPSGPDIAGAPIDAFIVRGLVVNKNAPLAIAEDFDRLVTQPYDRLLLVGTPKSRNEITGTECTQTICMIPATGVAWSDVSDVLKAGPQERVYGLMDADAWANSGIDDIDGISGGPVFGIWFNEDKSLFDYAAIGIQSGWDRHSGQFAAWQISDLSRGLAEHLAGETKPRIAGGDEPAPTA
jgi:hypothetical protein